MGSLKNKISVFLPTRAGSERIKDKNTRLFGGIYGGLLYIKLKQLLEVEELKEVVLSTNDIESIKVAQNFTSSSKLKIIERPDHLARSNTNLTDLVKYVPEVCKSDHILWTHVTSPLVKATDYAKAIQIYFQYLGDYDSLMSVKIIQNFVWSKDTNGVINKQDSDVTKWPRTQDLKKIYEVNSAIFIAPKTIYHSDEDRIGKKPYLLTHNQLQSVDVDNEEDFKLAEILYKNYN